MKCYACGGELTENAKFCGACGADQSLRPAAKKVCVKCGVELEPENRFCPHCGAAQEQAPAPEAALAEEPEIILSEPETVETPAADVPEEEAVIVEAPACEVPSDCEPALEPEPEPEPAPEPIPEPEPEPEPTHPTVPTPQPVPQPAPQPVQPQYPNPHQEPQQPRYQAPYPQQPQYQPAYQPQQNIQVNLGGVMPQRPAAPVFVQPQAPAYKLPCERGLLKMLLLSLLTCGVYPVVIYSRISMEINMVASRHDGKRTIHFLWVPILAVLTLFIYPFVWIHGLCNRIGGELTRRQIQYKFSAVSFWMWNLVYGIVGALITAAAVYILMEVVGLEEILVGLIGAALLLISVIGPWVFIHKMMKAMNLVNADYNRRG